jgi:hypothetical protein
MVIHYLIRSEKPADQVYYRDITGWPSNISKIIRLKVGALAWHGAFHRKIGITNYPERRWTQAYRHHGWVQMHVVYRSNSYEHVCELERMMVDRFRDEIMLSPGYYWNGTGGGGGRKPYDGPYFLYLVTAPKHSRITR